jgi:integrase
MANDILNEDIPNSTQESKSAEKKRRKKVPGIYQRGARYQIDTFYKGIRLRDSCATPEAADASLRKMKTLLDEGRWLEKKKEVKETVGELAKRYLKWCEEIRQKDLRSKIQRIGTIEEKLGKDTPLSKITRATVEKYQTDRLTSLTYRNTPLKPATVNREMAALKHMLSKAVAWGILPHNPSSGVKLQKENNRRRRYLTPEECKVLLDACPSVTMRQVITLALNTGMRRGEILNLTWDSINLRERYIELPDQKNGECSTIPLNSTVVDILRSIPRRLDSDYAFSGLIPGKPYCDLKRQFAKAVRKSKLVGVSFHTLRHSAASHLVMAGVDLATVREILRHKSIEMTLRYTHLSGDHKKAAVDALQNALTIGTEKDAKTA